MGNLTIKISNAPYELDPTWLVT